MKTFITENYKKLFFLLIAVFLYANSNVYMTLKDDEVKIMEYNGKEGNTVATMNLKMVGLKKLGRSMLWMKQILDVGGHAKDVEQQKLNSEMMSYLDPYFVTNYYYSSSVLALIRTSNRHDYGMEIIARGIAYNPDDIYLPLYAGGIVADKKNDVDESLIYFEKIVDKLEDERLLHTIAYVYDDKYRKSQDKELKAQYLYKAAFYYERLLYAKDAEYVRRAEKKLGEYSELLNLEY